MLGILVILTILALFYAYSTRKFNYWRDRNVFYIKPIPFLGNLLPIVQLKQTFGEWLAAVAHETNKDYFGLFMLDQPVLIVQSPKLIKAILQKDFVHFEDRFAAVPESHPILSNFLFFANNPKWKNLRTTMSPLFTSSKLKLMLSFMLEECDKMVAYIDALKNIPDVESKEICAKYSTNVIVKCAFAVDAHAFEEEDAEFRKIGRGIFDFRYSTAFRQLATMLAPKVVNFFNIPFIDPSITDRTTEIFLDVLHKRMNCDTLKGKDLVDILLEAGHFKQGFSENVMIGAAFQFYAAGFETVSSVMSFTLYELCIHPNIQERLHKEIIENIIKYNGITYEGISKMEYLDMCVSETLRKYPVLPFLDRICKRDYKVEGSDLIIEKGIPVYIPMFALHYDPKYFPEPDKYDPERFSDKSKLNNSGFYYFPFGEGPRNCIGNRFGLIGVKVGLVSILSKFKLKATSKTPIHLVFESKSFLIQSKVGIPLEFVPLGK